VGADAVARIGFSAERFSDGPSWERLTVVRAPDPAQSPAPYFGPLPTDYSDRTPLIGHVVVVSGLGLHQVTACTLDGTIFSMSNRPADSFTMLIPTALEPGLKDLVMTGLAGKLSAQGAFTVLRTIPAIINDTSAASKTSAG
jgi:hypothetical protein